MDRIVEHDIQQQTNEKINFAWEHMASLAIQSIPYLRVAPVSFHFFHYSSTKRLLVLLHVDATATTTAAIVDFTLNKLRCSSVCPASFHSSIVCVCVWFSLNSPSSSMCVCRYRCKRKWCDVNHIPNALPFHICLHCASVCVCSFFSNRTTETRCIYEHTHIDAAIIHLTLSVWKL